jgi:hypothetical protein
MYIDAYVTSVCVLSSERNVGVHCACWKYTCLHAPLHVEEISTSLYIMYITSNFDFSDVQIGFKRMNKKYQTICLNIVHNQVTVQVTMNVAVIMLVR